MKKGYLYMTPPQIALTFCMRKETVMAACTAELQWRS